MSTVCHNCRNDVPERALYCPECGAPQLSIQPAEDREAEQNAEGAEPRLRHTGEIAWPAAFQAAALFALPAGILISFQNVPAIFDMVWVVLGAIWTLRFYRRRAPRAPSLTPRLGGRIGLVLGIFVAILAVVGQSLRLLIERFLLHQGGAIDGRLTAFARAEIEIMRNSSPEATAQLAELSHFLLSPSGRVALLLSGVLSTVFSSLVFGWLTGRFAYRYGSPRVRKST